MIATIDDLRHHALFCAVILLWAHVPLVGLLAFALGTGGVAEVALLSPIARVVTFER